MTERLAKDAKAIRQTLTCRDWPAAQGALTATGAEEEVVPASDYRALHNQIRELQRLLGQKTLEGEILKEALEVANGPKKGPLRSVSVPQGGSR